MDLHPVPEISSIVEAISDVSTDGSKVYLAGKLGSRPTVWVVDVQTRSVIAEHVLPELRGAGAVESARAVNRAGEVVVRLKSGAAVWTRAGGVDVVDKLPSLFSKRSCSNHGRGINNDGTVVGWSAVFAKGRCVQRPVVWTKID